MTWITPGLGIDDAPVMAAAVRAVSCVLVINGQVCAGSNARVRADRDGRLRAGSDGGLRAGGDSGVWVAHSAGGWSRGHCVTGRPRDR